MQDIETLRRKAADILRANRFDPDWYRSHYEDVALLGMDPAEHYLTIGALLNRKPAADLDTADWELSAVDVATPPPVTTKPEMFDQTPLAEDFAIQTLRAYSGKKQLADFSGEGPLPRVSFVMTAHNAEDTIEAAVSSLLRQNYPDLEVVVCDDASSDKTWSALQNLQIQSPKALRILRVNQNGGTYLAKNMAIAESTGDIILFQDADDYSHPDRALVQVLPLLENPGFIATRSKYLRFNAETKRIVPVADLYSKYGLITLAVRRQAFQEIGFFDTVRKAGDDEWFQRLSLFYGNAKIHHVDVSLYLAELRENSLIADMLTFKQDGSVDQASSEVRKEYVRTFQSRFKDKNKKQQWYRNNFPPYPLRPNRTYPETVAALGPQHQKVFASACCIPARTESFRRVVDRLLPQVDGLFVFLDKFETVPDFLSQRPKITVLRSQDISGDPRDNAKFLPFNRLKAEHDAFYYFTCDDDILYPQDYVRAMIARLQEHDNAVVAGVHGVMYEENPRKYFRRRFIYHFQDTPLAQPVLVNNLGTGTVAFHSGCFGTLDADLWCLGGMVDILFSKECRQRGLPMLCIDRHAGWLCETEQSSGSPNLFEEFAQKENLIVNELRDMRPWGYQAIETTLARLPATQRDRLQALLPPFVSQQKVEHFFSRYR